MRFEVKKIFVVSPLIMALAACGGGGSDSSSPTNNSNVGTSSPTNGTGTVTSGSTPATTVAAAYVKGASPAYQFVGVSLQTSGVLSTVEQLTDGSVVTVNSNQLTGATRAVADVAGDANFALGRWSKGSATTASGTSQLESSVNGAYHYIVYNRPAAFPASGTYKCDEGKFTSPSLTNGTSSTYFAKATGTAGLSFAGSVATADLSISITAGSQQRMLAFNGRTLATPTTTVIAGTYLANGEGMSISTADAGNNKLRIVSAFRLIAGNSSYEGLAAFTCTPS